MDYITVPFFNASRDAIVANCEEWVSLRAEPRSGSERLMKVPLGTVIERWGYYSDFYICEVDGVIGFIDSDYLKMNGGY